MKVGIIGSRGIPNYHGGFEQFAENFSVYLAKKGIEVTVYNSSLHPYNQKSFKGVKIIKCKDPEDKLGTAGQFIYDLNCIIDVRKRNYDIILQLGYTSSSIWYKFLPKNAIIITNMDGLEWKRTKYNALTKKFLKYAEKLAAKNSDYLISDSKGIEEYLMSTYNRHSEFIAYGADVFEKPDKSIIFNLGLNPKSYNLIIARIEPENNIETILEGLEDDSNETIIIGDADKTKFGRYLKLKYINNTKFKFLGAIYDINVLNNLRYFSRLYFHGHSVGGTNPSLLEAMSCQAPIVAHDNIFNKSILKQNALYFSEPGDINTLLRKYDPSYFENCLKANLKLIKNKYSWDKINREYLDYFNSIINEN